MKFKKISTTVLLKISASVLSSSALSSRLEEVIVEPTFGMSGIIDSGGSGFGGLRVTIFSGNNNAGFGGSNLDQMAEEEKKKNDEKKKERDKRLKEQCIRNTDMAFNSCRGQVSTRFATGIGECADRVFRANLNAGIFGTFGVDMTNQDKGCERRENAIRANGDLQCEVSRSNAKSSC